MLPSHVRHRWDGWMLPGGAATVFYVPVASTGQGVVSAAFAGEGVLKKGMLYLFWWALCTVVEIVSSSVKYNLWCQGLQHILLGKQLG